MIHWLLEPTFTKVVRRLVLVSRINTQNSWNGNGHIEKFTLDLQGQYRCKNELYWE